MIRVLHDPPLDGPANMARDEALLNLVGSGHSPPTLRLYQWSQPTISLGYFQPYADFEALTPPASELAVVRRLTGGGAILHDLEITYSIVLPVGHSLLERGPTALYELAHQAIIASLAHLGVASSRSGLSDDSTPTRGPFFCFARRHRFDVLIEQDKVAGSAQRRTRQAILQHGSIILGNRFAQQPTALIGANHSTVPSTHEERCSRVRSWFVEECVRLGRLNPLTTGWSNQELNEAGRLVAKYEGSEWTRRV